VFVAAFGFESYDASGGQQELRGNAARELVHDEASPLIVRSRTPTQCLAPAIPCRRYFSFDEGCRDFGEVLKRPVER
jgi:hypothetical protein